MANNVFCNKSLEVKIWPQKEKYVNHSVGNCLINYNGQGCDSCVTVIMTTVIIRSTVGDSNCRSLFWNLNDRQDFHSKCKQIFQKDHNHLLLFMKRGERTALCWWENLVL